MVHISEVCTTTTNAKQNRNHFKIIRWYFCSVKSVPTFTDLVQVTITGDFHDVCGSENPSTERNLFTEQEKLYDSL